MSAVNVDEDDLLGSFMAEISKIPDVVDEVAVVKETEELVKPIGTVAVSVAAASKPVYKTEINTEVNVVVKPTVNPAVDSVFNVHGNPPPPSTAFPGNNSNSNVNSNVTNSDISKKEKIKLSNAKLPIQYGRMLLYLNGLRMISDYLLEI